jgi:hypothetical protein
MKKVIVIVVLVLLVLIVVAGVFFWYSMGKPLYEPGMVRASENLRAPLTPPEQAGDEDSWNVEGDIQLYHFSDPGQDWNRSQRSTSSTTTTSGDVANPPDPLTGYLRPTITRT